MSERFTLERILRDEDDSSGQSIRAWALAVEDGHLTIRGRSDNYVMGLRVADVEQFKRDLDRCVSIHFGAEP